MKKPHILYWKWNNADGEFGMESVRRKALDIIRRSMFDTVYISLHNLPHEYNLLSCEQSVRLLEMCCALFKEHGKKLVFDLDIRNNTDYAKTQSLTERNYLSTCLQGTLDENGAWQAPVFVAAAIGTYDLNAPRCEGILRCKCADTDADGRIIESTVEDVTAFASNTESTVAVRLGKAYAGKKVICFPYTFSAHFDLCGDEYRIHRTKLFELVKHIPLAGAATDEYGINLLGGKNAGHWFCVSDGMCKYYRKACGGELHEDMLWFFCHSADEPNKSRRTVETYLRVLRERITSSDATFYDEVKRYFGDDALVLCHPTWMGHSHCANLEIARNALDWWNVKRDFAQTDELIYLPLRMGMSRKCKENLFYNMWYSQRTKELATYFIETWCSARFGGRTHYLGYECTESTHVLELKNEGCLEAVSEMEMQIEKLNAVQTSRPNARVLIVFGMNAATNWAVQDPDAAQLAIRGKYISADFDFSNDLLNRFYLCDLVPSTEIENGTLTVENGKAVFCGHDYDAVIAVHPIALSACEKEFFRAYDKAGGTLFVFGDAENDLDGLGCLRHPSCDADLAVLKLKELGIEGNCGKNYCVFEDGSVTFTTELAENIGNEMTENGSYVYDHFLVKNVGNRLEIDTIVCGKHIVFRGDDFLYVGADNTVAYGKKEFLSIDGTEL